jgi:hypothetical protein
MMGFVSELFGTPREGEAANPLWCSSSARRSSRRSGSKPVSDTPRTGDDSGTSEDEAAAPERTRTGFRIDLGAVPGGRALATLPAPAPAAPPAGAEGAAVSETSASAEVAQVAALKASMAASAAQQAARNAELAASSSEDDACSDDEAVGFNVRAGYFSRAKVADKAIMADPAVARKRPPAVSVGGAFRLNLAAVPGGGAPAAGTSPETPPSARNGGVGNACGGNGSGAGKGGGGDGGAGNGGGGNGGGGNGGGSAAVLEHVAARDRARASAGYISLSARHAGAATGTSPVSLLSPGKASRAGGGTSHRDDPQAWGGGGDGTARSHASDRSHLSDARTARLAEFSHSHPTDHSQPSPRSQPGDRSHLAEFRPAPGGSRSSADLTPLNSLPADPPPPPKTPSSVGRMRGVLLSQSSMQSIGSNGAKMSVLQALGARVHELPEPPAASRAGGGDVLKAALRNLPPLLAMPQVRSASLHRPPP